MHRQRRLFRRPVPHRRSRNTRCSAIAGLPTVVAFILISEGLVLALAPLRFEDLLEALRKLTLAQRRNIGLGIVALGVFLIAVAKTGL